ncbi:hypothetical protein F4811DRAFT_27894 [Daldinia bambusicola]|nr:hypothetical protein F4811DRAFT_27894 [Daldinia bambusicola]
MLGSYLSPFRKPACLISVLLYQSQPSNTEIQCPSFCYILVILAILVILVIPWQALIWSSQLKPTPPLVASHSLASVFGNLFVTLVSRTGR